MQKSRTEKMARRVSARAVRRAVASSTAIETGESVTRVERKLRDGSVRFGDLKLASRNQ